MSDLLTLYNWLQLPSYQIFDTDVKSNVANGINQNNFLHIVKQYNIPLNVFIHKLVIYFKKKQTSNANIIKFMKDNIIDVSICEFINDGKVTELIEAYLVNYDKLYDDSDNINIIIDDDTDANKSENGMTIYDHPTLNNTQLQYLIDRSKFDLNKNHKGLPHPDLVKGRPKLHFLECYYSNCHKTFSNYMQLRQHLKTSCTKFVEGLHLHHENAVLSNNLTPEYIIQNKITKCASYVCILTNHPMTPEQLCNHYKLLGIAPFFNIDDKQNNKNFLKIYDSYDYELNNIYEYDYCIACFTTKPNIVFNPCNHNCLCYGCLVNYKNNTCPVCAEKIEIFIPY